MSLFVGLRSIATNIASKATFFALVIENGGLFSRFANVLALTRFDATMKNTSNIIAWTASDEDIHANLDDLKREIHKRSILSIAQTEKYSQ